MGCQIKRVMSSREKKIRLSWSEGLVVGGER
jgi:hypothetical protein